MAYNKYARTCNKCGKGMNEGYYIECGEYYCSDECLYKEITPEEWDELYNDGEGDSCWTTWAEDPDSYMVNEDDPAPNKLRVDFVEISHQTKVNLMSNEDIKRLFKWQLRKMKLDPDKYEFVNWTITCDVQIKEGDKA